METSTSFNPVLKERYKNPTITKMLGQLHRNDRPAKHKVASHLKAPRKRRLPKE